MMGAIKSFICKQKQAQAQGIIDYILTSHWSIVNAFPDLFTPWTTEQADVEVISVSSPTYNHNDSEEEILFTSNYKMDFAQPSLLNDLAQSFTPQNEGA